MQTIAQSFFELFSIDAFFTDLPLGGWPSLDDCPEDAICCYYGDGNGGES